MVNLNEVQRDWTKRYGARIPMPSPTGRNAEQLFLSGPVSMAYDSRYGRDQTHLLPTGRPGSRAQEEPDMRFPTGPGRAQDPDDDDARIARARTFLMNRLSREDFQRFSAILSGEDEGGGYDPDNDPEAQRSPEGGSVRRRGQDQPPAFRGMPETHLLPGTEPNIPERDLRETRGGRDRRVAQDSRGSDYHSQFGNADVVVNDYGGFVR